LAFSIFEIKSGKGKRPSLRGMKAGPCCGSGEAEPGSRGPAWDDILKAGDAADQIRLIFDRLGEGCLGFGTICGHCGEALSGVLPSLSMCMYTSMSKRPPS